jgi:hypothetical protein
MLTNLGLPPIFVSCPEEQQRFFLELALRHEKELSLHENPGKLWEKNEEGKDWSNVTEHCLMEAARVGVLAGFLGLADKIRGSLVSAALLHDFNKKEEVRLTYEDMESGGDGRGGVFLSEEASSKVIRETGFSEFVVSLTDHAHGDPVNVLFMKRILDSGNFSEENLAHFVMHYVDGYTRGSSWVEPVKRLGERAWNELDRRGEMNSMHPAYAKMSQEEIPAYEDDAVLRGLTRFEAAVALGHLLEKKFAELMAERGIPVPDPLLIP